MPTDSFLLGEIFSFYHEFTLILKSKWRDLNSRLGGCGIYVSEIYFSNFLKNKEGEKDWSDPQPDSTIQSKARGYSIWSASTSRTIYDQDFGAWAPHSLEARGSTWRTTRRIRSNQKDVLTTRRTRRRPAKYSTPAGLGYEALGGLSDPGQRDCLQT